LYRIQLTQTASKFLKTVDIKTQTQIIDKIENLKRNPEKQGKPLKGNLLGYFSLRAAGQRYGIIYEIQKSKLFVMVIAIGIRKEGDKKDIYRLLKKYLKLGLID